MLDSLTYATFEGREGQQFRVHVGADTILTAELVQVTDLANVASSEGPAGGEVRGELFSLIFRLPPTPMLPQAMYTFENEKIGTFPLFIVPVGRDAEGLQYEAVFNRTSRPAEGAP